MNIVERRDKILSLIKDQGSVNTQDILDAFDDSPATIRRDLVFLEEQGIIAKSRGFVKYIPPLQVCEITLAPGDYAIAQAAAELVPRNAAICIDSGIECIALAGQLRERSDISIVTNSVQVLRTMAGSNVETYGICGKLAPRQECMLGPDAENYVSNLHVQYLFFTTTGIRGTSGVTCVTPDQANIKSAFIKVAEKRVLLAKSHKFARDAVRLFASFDEIDVIVTDKPIESKELLDELKKTGTEVIVAKF